MVPRRSHRKSRHGCAECKRRRVKCDETRPSCTNCCKRATNCDYKSSAPYLWLGKQSPHKTPTPQTSLCREAEYLLLSASVSRISQGSCGEDDPSAPAPVALDLNNLELMVQWCSKTHLALTRNEKTQQVWQFLVPEEALSHEFLMHGLLAVSAIHLAGCRSQSLRQKYIDTAVAHQNQALAGFQKLLHGINCGNAKAVFAFSSILVIYSFGFLHLENANSPSTEVDDLYQALELSRGVQQILNISTPSIQDSSFNPLLDVRELERPVILPDEVQSALRKLYDANNTCGVRSTDHNTAVYQETIKRLEQVLNGVYQDPIVKNSAVRWAIKLPQPFLERLQEREPMSLVILGGYCVILHRLRHIWCFQGWGTRVFKSIWRTINPQWRDLTVWAAMEILGEIPSG